MLELGTWSQEKAELCNPKNFQFCVAFTDYYFIFAKLFEYDTLFLCLASSLIFLSIFFIFFVKISLKPGFMVTVIV